MNRLNCFANIEGQKFDDDATPTKKKKQRAASLDGNVIA